MKNFILAISPYLNEEDELVVHDMLECEATEIEILHYLNSVLDTTTKKEILDKVSIDDIDLKSIWRFYYYLPPNMMTAAVREELEYFEYLDKLSIEEQEWIQQFYQEHYNKGSYNIPEENRLLTMGEMIKEANRNNNSLDRDALTKAKSKNLLHYLEDQYDPNVIIEDEELDWEDCFVIAGYDLAVQKIFNDAIESLKNKSADPERTLLQFYIQMDRLRRLNNRDITNRRKVKK